MAIWKCGKQRFKTSPDDMRCFCNPVVVFGVLLLNPFSISQIGCVLVLCVSADSRSVAPRINISVSPFFNITGPAGVAVVGRSAYIIIIKRVYIYFLFRCCRSASERHRKTNPFTKDGDGFSMFSLQYQIIDYSPHCYYLALE